MPVVHSRTLSQPWLGIVATAAVVASCLLFAARVPPSLLTGWLGLALTAAVPTLVVQTAFWHLPLPGWKDQGRPVRRGLAGLGLMAAAAMLVTFTAVVFLGGGRRSADAFLMLPLISSVPLTLWLVFLLGGFPANAIARSSGAAGFILVLLAYGADYLLVQLGFNYGFLRESPYYLPQLDPNGFLDARSAVSILLAAAAFTLALVAFDFWPVDAAARVFGFLRRQPYRGLGAILLTLAAATVSWTIVVGLANTNEATFQARGCVSFIFGIFVLLVMFEGKSFSSLRQPTRGLARCAVALLLALIAYPLYAAVGIAVGADIGAPGRLQSWVATAMLAVTFPVMSILVDLFKFFPFRRETAE